jgi:uncharacterized protein YbaP (TraB family)
MQKSILAILFFTGLLTTTSAQKPTEKTLLWQVSGKGIAKPSYLFGTMHLMCSADLKVPQIVKEKFDSAAELYMEIDMDDPNMMKEMMEGMQMKDAVTLEKLMGNKFDSANAIFKTSTGMPLTLLNTAKPMLILSMIYPSFLSCTPASWESVFQSMAKEKAIEIKGLEQLQDQINIFEKIPYKVQSDMLVKTLLNIDSAKLQFRRMLNVYKEKDVNQLHQLTTKEEDFGEYQDILLSNRNHNWIPIIGEEAKKRPTFFAFGAGHLGGENGVINLLRKAGFTVKPIFYQ